MAFSPSDSVCYAARGNSYVVRADGRLNKCTVALEHPNNLNLAVFIGAVNQDIVPDADFAEIDDQNVLTSVIRMETEWARNQRDCTATWAALQQCAALAIEVKAA